MDGEDGPQRKGDGWKMSPRLLLNLTLLLHPLLPTPALLRAPAHRAQRGVCVPPASRHLEEERSQKEWLFVL